MQVEEGPLWPEASYQSDPVDYSSSKITLIQYGTMVIMVQRTYFFNSYAKNYMQPSLNICGKSRAVIA